jgi:arylformamidase
LKILDLSQELSCKMPVFPQDPDFIIKEILNSEKDDFTLSILNMGLHAGTHLDSPYHFYSSGRKVLEIPLDELMGPVKIIEVETNFIDHSYVSNSNQKIHDPGFEIKDSNFKNIKKGDIVIIKTGWSFKWGLDNYFTENPYLSAEAAGFLVEREIRGLAIDGPSVDPFGKTLIHKKLLFNDIWIVENLKNLELIPQLDNKDSNDNYNENNDSLEFFLIPLPLKSEASPVRAFARIKE